MHARAQPQRPDDGRTHRLIAVVADAHLDAAVEIDALDRFEKAVHEMLARLFAVTDDVDAGVLLQLDRKQRGVVLGGCEVFAVELEKIEDEINETGAAAIGLLTAWVLCRWVVRQWPAQVAVWAAAVAMIGLIGFSRCYLGVHFVTDVLAGWLLGAAWAGTVILIGSWWPRAAAPPRGSVQRS